MNFLKQKYEDSKQSDTLTDYLASLKYALVTRLPYHAGTDKSKISEKILTFSFVLDQLMTHLIAGQIISFIKLVDETIRNSKMDVKKCIRKTSHDYPDDVNEYRKIVTDLWTRIISKTRNIAIHVVEENVALESTAQIQEIKSFLNRASCPPTPSVVVNE